MADRSLDQRIAAEVLETLEHDSRLRPEGISVQVQEGVVTLTGTVGRHLDRMVAARDAWRVKGVVEVRNRLQVQPDTLRNAEELAAEIFDALAKDPRVDSRGMVVNVAEGLVRLSGTVPSDAARRAAEEDAWRVEGVVDVSNELAVSPAGRRTDREIEADVRAALDGDARISDPTKIKVRSVAGTVRLEGSISSGEEREAADKDAWYTAGVVYVENLLRVAGGRRRPAAA